MTCFIVFYSFDFNCHQHPIMVIASVKSALVGYRSRHSICPLPPSASDVKLTHSRSDQPPCRHRTNF